MSTRTPAQDLLDATAPDDIVRHLARWLYAKKHSREPDAKSIPTEACLYTYLRQVDLESCLHDGHFAIWLPVRVDGTARIWLANVREPAPGALAIQINGQHLAAVMHGDVACVHEEWCALPAPRPQHALADLVKAWWALREIVDQVAHACWQEDHAGAPCPVERIPTEADLCAYLTHVSQAVFEFDGRLVAWQPIHVDGDVQLYLADVVEEEPRRSERRSTANHLLHVHQAWQDLPEPRPPHPLATLVRAWWARPVPVQRNRRPDRTLPTRVAMAPVSDRRAGNWFAPAMHAATGDNNAQIVLPGFGPHVKNLVTPALPVALYDLGAGTVAQSRGGPAPLALRIWIEGVLSVNIADRNINRPVVLTLKLRDLLAALYPNGAPRPSEYWPRLNAASEALDSLEARVPWEDPMTGKRGLRRVVQVADLPPYPRRGHKEDLDNDLHLIVYLPPGAEGGPVVSPNLALWGVKSGAAYRALIGLAYRWWDPGVTRRIAREGKRRFWYQSDNPAHYGNRMTDAEKVALCFPTSTNKQRRHLVFDADRVLGWLATAGETREVDGRFLPPKRSMTLNKLPPKQSPKAG